MSVQLILNRSNYDSNSKRFIYRFNGSKKFEDYEVGLSTLNIYNSFYNISAAYGNNRFVFEFLGTNYTFVLSDGYYDISQLNLFLQNQCIINGLYLIDDMNNYVYYCEFVINEVEYGVNVVFYPVPTSLPTDWTVPFAASWSFPVTAQTPSITIGTNIGKIFGLTANTYPVGGPYTTTKTVKNNIVPELHTASSVILTCSLINNIGYSNPTNIFYTFGFTEDFGQLIKINPPDIIYSHVINTQHSDFTIQLLDQNLNIINLLDTDVVITVVLREKNKK